MCMSKMTWKMSETTLKLSGIRFTCMFMDGFPFPDMSECHFVVKDNWYVENDMEYVGNDIEIVSNEIYISVHGWFSSLTCQNVILS